MKEFFKHKVKTKVEKNVIKAFKVFFAIIAAIIFVLLFGYIVMWLWNWLMPDVLGLTSITYWQAVGILALSKILFGSFGNNRSGKKGRKFKNRCSPSSGEPIESDFTKWKYYEKFWEEEGKDAYHAFITRQEETKQ